MRIIKYLLKTTIDGYVFIISEICNGFFSIISLFFSFLYHVFKISFFKSLSIYFKNKESNIFFYLVTQVFAFSVLFIIGTLYIPNQNVVRLQDDIGDDIVNSIQNIESNNSNIQKNDSSSDNTEETYFNLFQYYGNVDYHNIDFNNLKNINNDVVCYLTFDGTNINYPIVQGTDNSYYLNNDIKKNYSLGGWPFMDYRNSKDLSNKNTIFYGHNLLNKTSFGSLKNVFTTKWFNSSNHQIIVSNENGFYIYSVFSIYESEPVTDYLQVDFYNDEFDKFINKIKSKSIFDFNVDVSSTDQIITLSTCSDNNKNRNVVHAKLINYILK